MNNIEVLIVTEGQTEQTFIREVLAPSMALKNIYLTPTLIGTPGHKGGNVKFERALNDIKKFLEQRNNTFISIMVDYFRIEPSWPGNDTLLKAANQGSHYTSLQKAQILQEATRQEIIARLPAHNINKRFIPYISMHEFEALLFSDPILLADKLGVKVNLIQKILSEYNDNPEDINNNPDSAPSKRLMTLKRNYRKVAMGSDISAQIGIDQMRQSCENFNQWITNLEALTK